MDLPFKPANMRLRKKTSSSSDERVNDEMLRQQLMMLDIDGVLTDHKAKPTDILTVAQALAVSVVGDLANNGVEPEPLHRAIDNIINQIRDAMHKRVDEGKLPDW